MCPWNQVRGIIMEAPGANANPSFGRFAAFGNSLAGADEFIQCSMTFLLDMLND